MAELRQLRYFAAVAEHGSFSAAALALSLSQPALSEAVRKLEDELGCALLVRSPRRTVPTPAGAVLLEEGTAVLAAFDAALERTRRAAAGHAGRLRVGFEAAGAGRLGTQSRARFAAAHPGVRVEPRRFAWGGEADGLRDGSCDVAFVWLPNDLTGLQSVPLTQERRYAGLAAGHPLATRDELEVSALDDEPLMWTRRAPRAWVDWWAVNPRPSGRAPTWGPENDNVEEMLEQVAEGAAYCIVPRSMTEFYARGDVAWVPLRDVEPLRIVLAWRAGDEDGLVERFVATARAVAAELGA